MFYSYVAYREKKEAVRYCLAQKWYDISVFKGATAFWYKERGLLYGGSNYIALASYPTYKKPKRL